MVIIQNQHVHSLKHFFRVAANSVIKIVKLRSCEDDESYNFLNSNIINVNEGNGEIENNFNVDLDNIFKINFPTTDFGKINELNGMSYVCGLLAKKMVKYHKGKECGVCDIVSLSSIDGKENLFILKKQYPHLSLPKGLTFASTNFFPFLLNVNAHFAITLINCI